MPTACVHDYILGDSGIYHCRHCFAPKRPDRVGVPPSMDASSRHGATSADHDADFDRSIETCWQKDLPTLKLVQRAAGRETTPQDLEFMRVAYQLGARSGAGVASGSFTKAMIDILIKREEKKQP